MKVHEMIEWLKKQDQNAEVKVLKSFHDKVMWDEFEGIREKDYNVKFIPKPARIEGCYPEERKIIKLGAEAKNEASTERG
jgi:hypothetical protein